ncbi:MAG TPA: hypothetical protein ENI23_13985 [bacterium]|nr:hypothetical protein [bacterium]
MSKDTKTPKTKEDFFGKPLNPAIEQLNSLVYWYPVLKQIRIPTPKTLIIYKGQCELGMLADGQPPPSWDNFEKRLREAMDEIGYPCFLRTGQLANKHDWNNSCFIKDDKESIKSHVANLVETSFMANIAGDPVSFDFWVVREMLNTKPVFTHFHGNMPIAREIRLFIKGGDIQCIHPYWPDEAFKDLDKPTKKKLKEIQKLPDKNHDVYKMAKYMARFFPGYWSVDFLEDKNGKWWCTDMAVGSRSYHYPDCKKNGSIISK